MKTVDEFMKLVGTIACHRFNEGSARTSGDHAKGDASRSLAIEAWSELRAALAEVGPDVRCAMEEAPKDQRLLFWFPDQGDWFPVVWDYSDRDDGLEWTLDEGRSAAHSFGKPTAWQRMPPYPTHHDEGRVM